MSSHEETTNGRRSAESPAVRGGPQYIDPLSGLGAPDEPEVLHPLGQNQAASPQPEARTAESSRQRTRRRHLPNRRAARPNTGASRPLLESGMKRPSRESSDGFVRLKALLQRIRNLPRKSGDPDEMWGGDYRVRKGQLAVYVLLIGAVAVACLSTLAFMKAQSLPTQFDQIVQSRLQPLQGRTEYQNQLEGFVGDAHRKAYQYVAACFNVINDQKESYIGSLQAIGAPDCGWNGAGTLQITPPIVTSNLGWKPNARHAIVGVMIQPAGQPLWLTYYVPFVTNDGHTAEFAGPGSLFGSQTRVSHVLPDDSCDGSDVPEMNTRALQRSLQDFMKAMTGDLAIDPNQLMVPGTNYQSFDTRNSAKDQTVRLVKQPAVQVPQLCSVQGGVISLIVNVSFKGPGSGKMSYTMPYAFQLQPEKAGGGTVYPVKSWGPVTVPGETVEGGG
jgi:hypothetical protein